MLQNRNMLIGLVGNKGVGKDTVANYVVSKYHFTKVAFATPLKQTCQAIYDLDECYFNDPKLKEELVPHWGLTPRVMMQRIGTDIIRANLGDDFWLKHMTRKLSTITTPNVIITDVRFGNEADLVTSLGGVLIRIQSLDSDTSDSHVSEQLQSIITDFSLLSDHSPGGLQKLYSDIDVLLEMIIVSS